MAWLVSTYQLGLFVILISVFSFLFEWLSLSLSLPQVKDRFCGLLSERVNQLQKEVHEARKGVDEFDGLDSGVGQFQVWIVRPICVIRKCLPLNF